MKERARLIGEFDARYLEVVGSRRAGAGTVSATAGTRAG